MEWTSRRRAKAIKGGDPRQNRAIAAKLTYPDLLIRECLHLGGFKNDELDVIKDQKHTWRTRKYLTYTPTWCTILHVCILSSLSLSVTYLSPPIISQSMLNTRTLSGKRLISIKMQDYQERDLKPRSS